MTDTERNFLGCGLAFPVSTDERGRVEFADGVTDIEQSIRIILGTAKGERVMRPEFGCGIHEYVFETIDATTLTLVRTSVEDALREWEPRIEVQDVSVSTDELDNGKLLVRIDYRVPQTNNEYNLVYPFYLEEGR